MKAIIKKPRSLDYWKKKLITVLDSGKMAKSLDMILYPSGVPEEVTGMLQKARGFPVGTTREWSGKKYKKLSSGKWMRTYTGEGGRGEKQAIQNVTKKIQNAKSMEELAKIVSANMQRFKDDSGKTLPIIKEFMTAARGTEAGKKETEEEKYPEMEKMRQIHLKRGIGINRINLQEAKTQLKTETRKPMIAALTRGVKMLEKIIADKEKAEKREGPKKRAKIIKFPDKPMTQKEIGEKMKLDNQKDIAKEFGVSVEKVQELSSEYRKKYPKRKVNIDTIRALVKMDIDKKKVVMNKESVENSVDKLSTAAFDAYRGTSFSPEKRRDTVIKDFKEELLSDLQELEKKDNIGNYQEKYLAHAKTWLSRKARVMSPMITGPANFPVGKNRKASDSEDKAWNDFRDWRQKYFKGVDRVSQLSPEDDKDVALKDLDKAIINQETMKGINKIVKNKKLDKEQQIAKIVADFGWKEENAKKIVEPDRMGSIGFPSFTLTNNNAKIKRLKDKVETMKRRIEAKESFKPVDFDGGQINIDNDRVTIKHDERPSREVIDKIKSRGFRWSRQYGVWSRKHTARALYDAKQLMGVDMKKSRIIVRRK